MCFNSFSLLNLFSSRLLKRYFQASKIVNLKRVSIAFCEGTLVQRHTYLSSCISILLHSTTSQIFYLAFWWLHNMEYRENERNTVQGRKWRGALFAKQNFFRDGWRFIIELVVNSWYFWKKVRCEQKDRYIIVASRKSALYGIANLPAS